MLRAMESIDFEAWTKKIPGHSFVNRDSTIVDLCRRKRVLHVGAADAPFHKEKALEGRLLHQKVQQVADSVIGIDMDAGAVAWLRQNAGINNIIVADAATVEIEFEADIVLCCDTIEHVGNPQVLLEACEQMMSSATILVLTTINALAFKPALRAMFAREAVHPDHVSYFSVSTLGQLGRRAGLVPVSVGFFAYGTRLRLVGQVLESLARLAPATADGIMMLLRKE